MTKEHKEETSKRTTLRGNLRSEDEKRGPENNLFQFSMQEPVFDYAEVLDIKDVTGGKSYESQEKDTSNSANLNQKGKIGNRKLLEPSLLAIPSPLSTNSTSPSSFSSSSSTDPLIEEKYAAYHRRMEREEKGIQRIERERNAIEMDRLETQKELLQGPSWKRAIRSITKIDNEKDEKELLQKRTLTLKEIDMYLGRYRQWRKRGIELRAKNDHLPTLPSSRRKKNTKRVNSNEILGYKIPGIRKQIDFVPPKEWIGKFAT